MIIYTLIETGMRRAAAPAIDIDNIYKEKRRLITSEKGGHQHTYMISAQGPNAIADYIENERAPDADIFTCSQALFLPAGDRQSKSGRLHPVNINQIWNKVCKMAGVNGRTPHSARQAMGKHLIDKTQNLAAVQRQLGHKNPAYSMQYTRITGDELQTALDERD